MNNQDEQQLLKTIGELSKTSFEISEEIKKLFSRLNDLQLKQIQKIVVWVLL